MLTTINVYTQTQLQKTHPPTHICIHTHTNTQIFCSQLTKSKHIAYISYLLTIRRTHRCYLLSCLHDLRVDCVRDLRGYMSTSRLLLLLENYNAIFTWFTIRKGWQSFHLGRVDICGWLSMHKKYIFVTISSGLINCNINQMFYRDIPENTRIHVACVWLSTSDNLKIHQKHSRQMVNGPIKRSWTSSDRRHSGS